MHKKPSDVHKTMHQCEKEALAPNRKATKILASSQAFSGSNQYAPAGGARNAMSSHRANLQRPEDVLRDDDEYAGHQDCIHSNCMEATP